jgi:hypothetical protein
MPQTDPKRENVRAITVLLVPTADQSTHPLKLESDVEEDAVGAEATTSFARLRQAAPQEDEKLILYKLIQHATTHWLTKTDYGKSIADWDSGMDIVNLLDLLADRPPPSLIDSLRLYGILTLEATPLLTGDWDTTETLLIKETE